MPTLNPLQTITKLDIDIYLCRQSVKTRVLTPRPTLATPKLTAVLHVLYPSAPNFWRLLLPVIHGEEVIDP